MWVQQEALEEKKKKLDEDKTKAVEEASKIRVTDIKARQTDFDKFVREREEENKTFYKKDEPMFDRVGEPAMTGKKADEIPDIGLTEEERAALS